MSKYAIVGDVHGCIDEFAALTNQLLEDGYVVVSVGDLCDRGPDSLACYDLMMWLVETGQGLMTLGNHDDKLRRYLKAILSGKESKIKMSHGFAQTASDISKALRDEPERVEAIYSFLSKLPHFLSLDDGKLIVAHAAMPEKLQGQLSGKKQKRQRATALYGVTTGKTLPNGFPERVDWAEDYTGDAIVVHGHVRLDEPSAKNNVYNVDTSCVYGGKLTALLYPSLEFVSLPAFKTYHVSS